VSGRSKDQDLIDWLAAKIQGPDPKTAQTNGHTRTAPGSPTDEMVIEKCRAAKDAARFSELFDHGDTSANDNNASSADYALLGILKFWTQDPDQLDRIMRLSALRRPKWDEGRAGRTWLRYSIDNTLRTVDKTYDWGSQRGRTLVSSLSSPYIRADDNDTSEDDLEIVWFSELGEPKEREYLIEAVGVKSYPIIVFGAGGVAKSFGVLSAGVAIASASGVEDWLGLRVLEHGHVLYLDFELDTSEQHRRVRDMCAGLGVPIPKRLAYLSGLGVPTPKAFKKAQDFVGHYSAKAIIIDSLGLALEGDMERGRDVLAFYRTYIDPLRRAGTVPFIVDHEGKLQAGEKHKNKSPIGSAYKAWAARSVLQFELDEYDKENSALDIRVRQTKTNFTPVEPFGVRFTFEEKKVSIETRALLDTELIEEERIPMKERIVGALRNGPATNAELQKLTGAGDGTVRNKLSELMQEGTVIADDGRPKTYRLAGQEVSLSSHLYRGNDSDDTREKTVSGLFANPPGWLVKQLRVYREAPERHLKPLCAAVAAAILADPDRAPEVEEDVRKEVRTQSDG
jgi:AAA domain